MFIPILGWIAAYFVMYSALSDLGRVTKSPSLLGNFKKYIIAWVVGALIGAVISIAAGLGSLFESIVIWVAGFLIQLSLWLYIFIQRYKIYKELSQLTRQPLFLWAF